MTPQVVGICSPGHAAGRSRRGSIMGARGRAAGKEGDGHRPRQRRAVARRSVARRAADAVGLMDRGVHGRLTSVIPPITVPAWSCMMASRTPGDLGVYGFRNRSDHTYDGRFIADGSAIKAPRLWDLVGRAGGSSIVVGVPGTYPPRPLRGALVTCFLTPSVESTYTYPPGLKDEIADVVGEYMFDVKDFRTENKAAPRAALRDDGPALPACRPPARDAAVAAVRDGRDGPRPHPSRLLEVHGRRAPQARARQRVRVGDPRLLQACGRPDGRAARACRRGDDSCSSSPTTARSGSTAGFA